MKFAKPPKPRRSRNFIATKFYCRNSLVTQTRYKKLNLTPQGQKA